LEIRKENFPNFLTGKFSNYSSRFGGIIIYPFKGKVGAGEEGIKILLN